MTDPITIEGIELSGFRAFLEPQTISLRNRKQASVAIFGRNGTGKSSLVDSLEYYFSEKGTLNILGKKKTDSQAGPTAIRHLEADKANANTYVRVWFKQGADEFGDLHRFPAPPTKAAKRVLGHTKVPFIIRENDLNRFVLATRPNERYNELAGWLRMETLLKIQDNLKALRGRIKKESERSDGTAERLKDLEECTDGKILEWREPEILDWLNNNVLVGLGIKSRLEALSEEDPAFQELRDLAEAEQKQTGLEDLRGLLATIDGLHARPATRQEPAGKIAAFEAAALDYDTAAAREERIRSDTKEAVFNEVWRSAKILLEGRNDLDRCPVCEMEFSSSPHGSRDSVRASLGDNLSKLEEYAGAEKERDDTKVRLDDARADLETGVVKFLAQAGSAHPHGEVGAYGESLKAWNAGKGVPDSTSALDALAGLHSSVEGKIGRIGQHDECAFGDALGKVQKLLGIKAKLDLISRTKEEMGAVYGRATEQSNEFNRTITEYIQGRIGSLTGEMNAIYKDIRGTEDVPGIRIALGKEGGVEQRTAQLFIDLEGHKGLPPSGFQSQSQINTLALAFRLAAVHMFNDAKIIILDDIVSSYDEEHRSNIAAVLDEYFKDFQIILSTHEQTFFDSLRSKADKNHWQFKEIQYLKPGYGPIFDDHKTDIEKIREKHERNETAGNEMRKLVEERLFDICKDFQTQIKMRDGNRYDMEELKVSLNNFLNKKKLALPKNPHGESTLEILGKLPALNRGSHYRHGQSSSVGDEKHDLKIIEYFLELFACQKCGRDRFVRKNGMPICRHKKCGAEFSFQHSNDAATARQMQ